MAWRMYGICALMVAGWLIASPALSERGETAQIEEGPTEAAPQPILLPVPDQEVGNSEDLSEGHGGGGDPLDQGGDNCAAVTVVGALPYNDTGTTLGRTNDWNTAGSCAGGGGGTNAPDVIYRFTPPSSTTYLISTCGSAFNTLLEVRTGGACPGTTQVACADAGCGGDAEIRVTLTAGVQFWIIVDGWGTQAGAYALRIAMMCAVTSQMGDLTECAETVDSSHARLDCNGGPCNTLFGGVASYTDIACGQTYFARGFTYTRGEASYFDTDWYRFSLSEACTVRIRVEAEFPSVVSAGTALAACADHPYITSGNTCTPYTLTIPNVAPGSYEFTVRPWDGAGIPAARDYRVTLECAPMSGCVIDGSITAPGSVSSTTCGAGNDCELGGQPGPDRMYRVIVPSTDDWTFDVEGFWQSDLGLMRDCCDSMMVWAPGSIGCWHLAAGEYFVKVDAGEAAECGDFTLSVTLCRGRCCYGGDTYQTCVDTSFAVCETLGGIFDIERHCATDPCPHIATCPPNAAFSLRPYGVDSWGARGEMSDTSGRWYFENFTAGANPLTRLRFWGYHTQLGSFIRCPRQPQQFYIEFRSYSGSGPGDLVASFAPTIQGWSSGAYEGDTLFCFDYELEPPIELDRGWVGIAGDVYTGCGFWWAHSPFGDVRGAAREDGHIGTLSVVDHALCLVECVVDGAITAPGSFSGNTCGAGDDCDASGMSDAGCEEQTLRVYIPDTDDWTFALEEEVDWSSWHSVMDECCSGRISYPSTRCLRLDPGWYYVVVTSFETSPPPVQCGPYTLTVERCRERCCYGEDFQLCADTSLTACQALGGILDYGRDCGIDPCPYIPPCPDHAEASQPPAGFDSWFPQPHRSDVEEDIQWYDNFSGITAPISHLRVWGALKDDSGLPCLQDPLPVHVEFYAAGVHPEVLIATRMDTLPAREVSEYGETLYEYNMMIDPPVTLSEGWVSVLSSGDPNCAFCWYTSDFGDNEFYLRNGTAEAFHSGADLAFCLGSCPEPDSLVLQVVSGDTMRLGFYAPLDAVYRFYYTTNINSEFPTDYLQFHSAYFTAGAQTQWLLAPPTRARFVVTTDCATPATTASSPSWIVRIE